jgi:recombination protein RecR
MSHSPLIQELVTRLQVLPGVGPKSAQRMAYDLLQRNRPAGLQLAQALQESMEQVGNCQLCQNLSENATCPICADPKRQTQTLCVVETPADVMAIEQTSSYFGMYFVLMGHLSPLDGIGPNDIGIPLLLERVEALQIQEVILATNSTPEGEATAFYITEQLQHRGIQCSRIAHGIPIGGELEYLDSGTVSKALFARTICTTH